MDMRQAANMIATDLHFKLRNKTIDRIDISVIKKAIVEETKKDSRLSFYNKDAFEFQVTHAVVEKVG